MWKKLRDGHRQALNKKRTTTGLAISSDNRLWKYEKQMDFLLPHLANRQRSTDVSATATTIIKTDTDETVETLENTEENSELTTNNESQQTNYNIPRNKRKTDRITEYVDKEQKRRDERSIDTEELLSRKTSVEPKKDTPLKKFFDSMYDLTDDLPEYLQIKVQRHIFNSVMEAREEKLQKQSETSTRDFTTHS